MQTERLVSYLKCLICSPTTYYPSTRLNYGLVNRRVLLFSLDAMISTALAVKHIIVHINPLMLKAYGHSFLHISESSAWVEYEQIFPEVTTFEATKIIDRIG